MRNDRFALGILAGLGGLLLAAIAVGCFSASVDSRGWQDVAREYKETYSGSGSDRDRAVQAAREAAIEAGLTMDQLADYSIATESEDGYWWVSFHHRSSDGKTWPSRFVVRVDSNRKIRLYRNPANAPSH